MKISTSNGCGGRGVKLSGDEVGGSSLNHREELMDLNLGVLAMAKFGYVAGQAGVCESREDGGGVAAPWVRDAKT